jgi:hypothetical protein
VAQNACTGSVITKPQGLRDAPAGGNTALHSRITTRPSPRSLVLDPPGDLARAVPSAGVAPADARARAALSAAPAGGNTALHSRITMRPSPRALAGLAPTLFVLVLVLVLVLHIAATATVGFLLFLARRVVN